MADFTLVVPDDIVERARQIAAGSAQSVETILLNQLQQIVPFVPSLPADLQSELDLMRVYSDEALENMAYSQMPKALQDRILALGDKNSLGKISSQEHEELAALVELGERQMLRKAQAMALLVERGHALDKARLKPRE